MGYFLLNLEPTWICVCLKKCLKLVQSELWEIQWLRLPVGGSSAIFYISSNAAFYDDSTKSFFLEALGAVSKKMNIACFLSLKPVTSKDASEVWLWVVGMMDGFHCTGINPTEKKGPCILVYDALQPKALWLQLVLHHVTSVWLEEAVFFNERPDTECPFFACMALWCKWHLVICLDLLSAFIRFCIIWQCWRTFRIIDMCRTDAHAYNQIVYQTCFKLGDYNAVFGWFF